MRAASQRQQGCLLITAAAAAAAAAAVMSIQLDIHISMTEPSTVHLLRGCEWCCTGVFVTCVCIVMRYRDGLEKTAGAFLLRVVRKWTEEQWTDVWTGWIYSQAALSNVLDFLRKTLLYVANFNKKSVCISKMPFIWGWLLCGYEHGKEKKRVLKLGLQKWIVTYSMKRLLMQDNTCTICI